MNTAEIFPWACSIAAVAGLLWCAIDRDGWKRRAAAAEQEAEDADAEQAEMWLKLQDKIAECDQVWAQYNKAAAERDDHGKACDQLQTMLSEAKRERDQARQKFTEAEARIAAVVKEGDRKHDLANSLQSRVAELESQRDELQKQKTDLIAAIEKWRDDCTNARSALAEAQADLQSAVKVAEHRAGQISELGRELEVADKAKTGWRRDCEKYQELYWQVRDAMNAERQRRDIEAKAVQA